MRFAVGAASDLGQRRSLNEDCALVSEWVVAVADGMGGHVGGEVASEVAIEALRSAMDDPEVLTLADAAALANTAVWDRGAESDLRGMGTTLCALALVHPDELADDDESTVEEVRLALVNVGDSRAYRLVDGAVERLTEDHSLVEGLVREGRITSEEAALHPQRNVVTRVLGIGPLVDIDAWDLEPAVGDRYLLCSDGLFNEVEEPVIGATLRRLADPQEAAHELVSLANRGGGRDNITVVIVDLVDDDGEIGATFGDRIVRTRSSVRDMAGFTAIVDEGAVAAPDDADAAGDDGSRARSLLPRRERAAVRSSPRVTWRTGIFVLLVVGVFAVAAAAVAWYGQNGFFVDVDPDTGEVAVFEGRPGGFLWFEPTLVESTGVQIDALTPVLQERIAAVPEFASFGDAEAFLANVAEQQAASRPTTTSTSTTSSTSTTTTSTSVPGTPTPP